MFKRLRVVSGGVDSNYRIYDEDAKKLQDAMAQPEPKGIVKVTHVPRHNDCRDPSIDVYINIATIELVQMSYSEGW